jgi:Fe-S-cluster-containing dehydrogenase component
MSRHLPIVDQAPAPPPAAPSAAPAEPGVSRRDFVKLVSAGATAMLAACDTATREAFLHRHFRELTDEQRAAWIRRLEADYSDRYGKKVTVGVEPALPGVVFGYALDLSRCIGCRRCVYACVKENNQSRDPQVHWITVLEMEKQRGVDVMHADAYYNPDKVPREGHFYMPVSCQQCRNPPCVKVCPVGATWKEPDGIVVVDYDWCIGCRCCMSACPYGARHFNWTRPSVPADEVNPTTHALGNRPRPRGVVEKCTFCIQRVRKGLYPACVEICPVGARKFGNLLDPSSEVRYIIENKRVFLLKEDLGTAPKFFYFYGV